MNAKSKEWICYLADLGNFLKKSTMNPAMMNKAFFLVAVSVLFFTACNQKSQGRQVPDDLVEAFQKLHPNATILKWNDEPPIWEAKYKDGNEKGAVSFNLKSEVVETELVIEQSQLPNGAAIPDYIRTNYPNEKIQRCEKVTKQDGHHTYEIQITGKEIVFDANGKYLEEEPD